MRLTLISGLENVTYRTPASSRSRGGGLFLGLKNVEEDVGVHCDVDVMWPTPSHTTRDA